MQRVCVYHFVGKLVNSITYTLATGRTVRVYVFVLTTKTGFERNENCVENATKRHNNWYCALSKQNAMRVPKKIFIEI